MRISRSLGVHPEVVLERGLETQELKPTSSERDVPGIRDGFQYAGPMLSSLHSEARCKSDHGTPVPPLLTFPLFLGQRLKSKAPSML